MSSRRAVAKKRVGKGGANGPISVAGFENVARRTNEKPDLLTARDEGGGRNLKGLF